MSLYSSNVIIHGISENEDEEGPERYRLIMEVIARTIYASSYEEQIQIARKIPIKKDVQTRKIQLAKRTTYSDQFHVS